MPSPMTAAELRRVEALRRWATLLDAAFGIPGTRFRFGLDALIGLVPGAGDAVAGLFSLGILVQAARMGVPRVVVLRMVFNALLDLLVGAIPLVGDLFDIGWKANLRNVNLLDRYVLGGQRRPTRGDYLFVGGLVAVMVAAALLPVVVLALLIGWYGVGNNFPH